MTLLSILVSGYLGIGIILASLAFYAVWSPLDNVKDPAIRREIERGRQFLQNFNKVHLFINLVLTWPALYYRKF